uniref:Pns 7-2 n=1 Tax=Panagrellus redivivus TaxID=6233 RepID=A0A7E4VJJ7_PANRE
MLMPPYRCIRPQLRALQANFNVAMPSRHIIDRFINHVYYREALYRHTLVCYAHDDSKSTRLSALTESTLLVNIRIIDGLCSDLYVPKLLQ